MKGNDTARLEIFANPQQAAAGIAATCVIGGRLTIFDLAR